MAGNLFNASFEKSKRLVKKKDLKKEDNSLYTRFRSRLIGSLIAIFFFGIMIFAIGFGMPQGMLESSPSEIFVISYDGALLIGKIGLLLKTIMGAS